MTMKVIYLVNFLVSLIRNLRLCLRPPSMMQQRNTESFKSVVKKEMPAAFMSHCAIRHRYQSLKNAVAQNYTMVISNYPKTMEEVVNLLFTCALTTRQGTAKHHTSFHDQSNRKITFVQARSKEYNETKGM